MSFRFQTDTDHAQNVTFAVKALLRIKLASLATVLVCLCLLMWLLFYSSLHPSQSLTVVVALLPVIISASVCFVFCRMGVMPPAPPPDLRAATAALRGTLGAVMEGHFSVDAAVDTQLQTVVADTEKSALTMVDQTRKLNDSATVLLNYLSKSNEKAYDIEDEIGSSVEFIGEIGHFVQDLPERIRQHMRLIESASKNISELASLVSIVKDISKQTNLLSINAAIEAARAGENGRSFAVVADEVRKLSSRSREAAVLIERGLNSAEQAVHEGLDNFLRDYDEQMSEASKVVISIHKLRDNYEDIRQYYKTLFGVVTQHNVSLAREIAEMLGLVQYQDVARQRIERITTVVKRRDELFAEMLQRFDQPDASLDELKEQMESVLKEYLEEESRHDSSSSTVGGDGENLPKLELF